MSESWYRLALTGDPADGGLAGYRTRKAADVAGGAALMVVAPGQHLGDAIDAAIRRFGKDVWAVAAANAAGSEVPLGESVGKGVVVERGPAPEVPVGFRWPRGVIPSLSDAARSAAAAEGWARRPAEGVLAIEAQVAGTRLSDVFLDLVERLPVADNLEVKVLAHLDDAGTTEVWLSPRLDVRRAIHVLDDHDVDLLDSGHVELSLYLRAERSTLRLTEHKTIVWISEDESTGDRFTGWLDDLDVPRRDSLETIADLEHFHYRPARSSGRAKLLDRLRRLRLRKVDAWSGAA